MNILEAIAPFLIRMIADGLVFAVVLIGAYVLLRYAPRKNWYQVYARLFTMGLTAYLLAKVAGMIYQPGVERPFIQAGVQPGAAYLDNPGFPSDHALFVFVITLAVWVATKRRGWTTVLLILSLLVCAGRVLALVHTPLDVVAAFVIVGIAGVAWYGSSLFENKVFANN
jgi:undecaprenyl-diphosphatase